MRPPAALLLAAALLASASPARAQQPPPGSPAREQADRAEALMDRLYADHGNREILREAEALVRECLDSGNHRTAEFVQGQLVYHRPQDLQARHLYARILLLRGKRGTAEKDLRDLLREVPSDGAAYDLLADLLRAAGDPRAAMEVHEARLREHPGQAGALQARASLALWDLRDPAAARAEARRMRDAAAAPRASAEVAAWLRENAAWIEACAGRMERDARAIGRAERRVDLLLGVSLLAALLALAGAVRLTRPA